jgi:hypothetical protein
VFNRQYYDPKGPVTNSFPDRVPNGSERRINVGTIRDLLGPGTGAALPDSGTSQGAVLWSRYRSLLGFLRSSSDGPVGPRSGLEEDRTIY